MIDLPQTYLEPILVTTRPPCAKVRFDTEFLSLTQERRRRHRGWPTGAR